MARKSAARSSRRSSRKRGGGITINWGEAELQNRLSKSGTYLFKVANCEEGDNDNIVVDAEVISEGSQEGKTLRIFFSTTPQALWKLAQFIEACGEEVPDSEADFEPSEFIEKEFMADVQPHEYEGKTYMRAETMYPPEDDEAPAKGKKGKKGKDEEEEEEEEEDRRPAARGRRGEKAAKKGRARDEEEEEEEEEAPRGRGRPKGSKDKKAKGAKLPKVSADEIQDMNEEELDDLVDKYNLEVDLNEAKSLRKKAALVIDALEERELLEEE